jgi:hypothetical protein
MASEHILIAERLTHRYRAGWEHQDRWRDLGFVKATREVLVQEPREYDEVGVYKRLVVIPRGMDAKRAHQALRDTLNSAQPCDHEYDCCGCLHWHASIKRIGRRTFSVRTSYYRNY